MPNNNKQRGLGRGFDTLIPKNLDTVNLLNQGERIQNILIGDLQRDKNQPRTQFDAAAITELAESIKLYGIIQPLVVSQIAHNKYEIVAGERRWRAAGMAGLERVPAIIRSAKAQEKLEIALIENVQRVDLSPLDQAISIEKLHQEFNITYVDVAARLGKAPTTINNIVRLLHLPRTAREALQSAKITEGHARAILAIKGQPAKQEELLRLIISKHWTVRQAEQFVVALKNAGKDGATGAQVQTRMAVKTPASERLAKNLDTEVTLKRTAKGGRIEINFKDDSHLEQLLKKLDNRVR